MSARRLLVTGAAGQLGSDLIAAGNELPFDVVGVTRAGLDVTDQAAIEAVLRDVAPEVVVNATAYNAVDAAEAAEAAAQAVNGTAPGLLAVACGRIGARLLHVSTDYVFAGDASSPYPEDAPTGPRSAYGRTKLAGEQAVRAALPDASWVVRTAWVYGATGRNFVKTMVRLAGTGEPVSVVDDQRGSPTWSADLARGLLALASSDAPSGIYHCTNGGDTTWYGFARAVFAELGADPDRVRPTTSANFPRPAPRPAYSVLSGAAWLAAGLPPPRPWRDALHEAFRQVGAALRGG